MPMAFSSPSSRSSRACWAAASRLPKALATARAMSGRPAPTGTSAYQPAGHGPGASASMMPMMRVRSSGATSVGSDVSPTLSAAASSVHGWMSYSSPSSVAAARAAGEAGS